MEINKLLEIKIKPLCKKCSLHILKILKILVALKAPNKK
jgi:hypothetical protein